jgi:hypothetical protein
MQLNAQDWSNARCNAEQLAERLGCCLIGVKLDLNVGHDAWRAIILQDDKEVEVALTSERGGR